MKKKLTTIIAAAVLALAMTASLALMGCDDPNAVRYDFVEAKAEQIVDGVAADSQITDVTANMLTAVYKDSYIKVGEGSVKLVLKDSDSTLTVKKDGDKDILAGDYVETLKESLTTSLSGVTFDKYEMYGTKTDTGYNIVIYAEAEVMGLSMKLKETLVFKAA